MRYTNLPGQLKASSSFDHIICCLKAYIFLVTCAHLGKISKFFLIACSQMETSFFPVWSLCNVLLTTAKIRYNKGSDTKYFTDFYIYTFEHDKK